MFFKKINYVYFKTCGICGKTIFSNSYTCVNCLSILKYYKERIILNPNNFCDFILNMYEYKGIIKNQMWKFKFRDAKYIGKTFAELMSFKIEKLDLDFDIIIPVPISLKRYLERGYNQSYEVSKHIGKLLNKKFFKNVLIKTKNNKRQSDLNIIERQKNVIGVYSVMCPEKIKDKKILLVDDIYTTGATINECARILKLCGVKKVIVVTIAYA